MGPFQFLIYGVLLFLWFCWPWLLFTAFTSACLKVLTDWPLRKWLWIALVVGFIAEVVFLASAGEWLTEGPFIVQ